MCLNSLFSGNYPKTGKCYKIYEQDGIGLVTPYFRSPQALGNTYIDNSTKASRVNCSDSRETYTTGFHAYAVEYEAHIQLVYLTSRWSADHHIYKPKLVLVECTYSDLIVTGFEDVREDDIVTPIKAIVIVSSSIKPERIL